MVKYLGNWKFLQSCKKPIQTTEGGGCLCPWQNSLGLRFWNKNWYIYYLLSYKYTEKNFFLKKVNIWAVMSRIGSIIGEKLVKKVKNHYFLIISFHVQKSFWSSFSVNGSFVDDKDVHKGLKIKIVLKTSIFCVKVELFQKMFICRLKKLQNWISQGWKEQWLCKFSHY